MNVTFVKELLSPDAYNQKVEKRGIGIGKSSTLSTTGSHSQYTEISTIPKCRTREMLATLALTFAFEPSYFI